MFWPWKKHKFGWYVEPAYDYSFGGGHEQSVGIATGLLISIPYEQARESRYRQRAACSYQRKSREVLVLMGK
jgi:hypothetical protein